LPAVARKIDSTVAGATSPARDLMKEDLAIEIARKKKDDPGLPYLVSEMENQLVTAQVTLPARSRW
jgi:hypothetical protein